MPRQAKKVPRPCPRCGKHLVRQKYFDVCGYCKREEKKRRKEIKRLSREFREVLRHC